MARSLEGRRFFAHTNNGVTALIALETHIDHIRAKWILNTLQGADQDMLSQLYQGPIFTFARPDRTSRSPWLTGDQDDFESLFAYIGQEGGTVDWDDVFVPFSNAAETGVHGPEAQRRELGYVTTMAQFVETFGITLGELQRWPRRHSTLA